MNFDIFTPMHSFYNLLIFLASGILKFIGLFSTKIRTFVSGRKDVFQTLEQKISASDQTFWFHCASLGEFEQGVPVIENVRELYPNYKIVISFFSPSGYENKKNSSFADAVVYLPIDTASNAKKFIDAVHPTLAFFVKYEFWPNYLFELQKRHIPTYLLSGVFRKNQIFFKSYGSFMRKALQVFDHFFVQEENSKGLLESIGIRNVTISGDTRFDRVSNQLKMNNYLDFAENFKGNSLCVVFGSTWLEDEDIILDFINKTEKPVKFIIAPHQIETEKIDSLIQKIHRKVIRHSAVQHANPVDYDVLVIDCIGLLGRLYSYADIAYVGGAAGKTGLHNILEPATFGIPIIIGKNYDHFPEAKALKQTGGLFSVSTPEENSEVMTKLVIDTKFRTTTGQIVKNFVANNTGATEKIIGFMDKNHNL